MKFEIFSDEFIYVFSFEGVVLAIQRAMKIKMKKIIMNQSKKMT